MAGTAITYTTPKILASGETFAQLQAGGLAGTLANLMAANPAIANPTTAPTVAVTGGGSTGGALAVGTYYLSYAWDNGVGRTLPIETAAPFVVAAGNIPQVTIPSLPAGASSAHIYLTPPGGASGGEVLYAAGVTTTTFNLSSASYQNPNGAQPTSNTTALASVQGYLNTGGGRILQQLYEAYVDTLTAFLSGRPMDAPAACGRLRQLTAVFKALFQACEDAAALCHANTGTLGPYSPGPGRAETQRTWP